jgi:hypothetical protein
MSAVGFSAQSEPSVRVAPPSAGEISALAKSTTLGRSLDAIVEANAVGILAR